MHTVLKDGLGLCGKFLRANIVLEEDEEHSARKVLKNCQPLTLLELLQYLKEHCIVGWVDAFHVHISTK